MAVATAAGMFSSMVLTLLIVPVFYLALDDLSEWARGLSKRLLESRRSTMSPTVQAEGSAAGHAVVETARVPEDRRED